MRRRWGTLPPSPRGAAVRGPLAGGEVVGTIALVVEDRFRLIDDLGRGYLFTLSRTAGRDPDELVRWADAGCKVHVVFRGAPDLGAVAERVRPADGAC